jgi:hypothetical protein
MILSKPKSMSLYIVIGLFIITIITILILFYYNSNKKLTPIPTTPMPTTPMPTTPMPTTPIPTTPMPTTPIPTTPIPTPSSMILSFEGDWVSYKISGREYGPVTLRATGPYSLYIEGGSIGSVWDNMRVLTVDPTTLSCSLPVKGINNFGTALMYEGKPIKIMGNNGITLNRSNQLPTITTSPVTTDPYEGTWVSYIYAGNEYGPITILSMGQPNTYYIYGGSFTNDNYRVLSVDPNTLSFSLPLIGMNNFGKALMYGGKAIKIIGQQVSLNRSNQLPTITTPPVTTDPYEGTWVSYKDGNTEYGPVTILSTGEQYTYYIYGGNVPNDNYRILKFDINNLSFNLPFQNNINIGKPLMYGGKALSIGEDLIRLKRSNEQPIFTSSPTTTDPYEGTWVSYKDGNNEYGPVTILSTGEQYKYYIYGGSAPESSYYRLLTIDPTTLSCSLPIMDNFGIVIMIGGKAIKIISNGNSSISFNRSNEIPTVSPTTTDPMEGTWVSYIYDETEYGPVTILGSGKPNTYYIYGGNVRFNSQRLLTIDPTTLSCSLPQMDKNNFGIVTIVDGKAMEISGNQGISFKRLNQTPSPTDPMEGSWVSYKFYGTEYGPVTILSSGQPNKYKIDGPNMSYELKVLTYDPTTLYCSLPNKSKINFGIALTYRHYGEGGKVMEIVSNEDNISSEINLKRSIDPPLLTPTITDPYQGNWISYKVYGTEYGPVIIIPTLQNTYYIYGGSAPSIRLRILTFNPETLDFSLPRYNMNDFGKATVINDKAIKISNNNGYVTFTR